MARNSRYPIQEGQALTLLANPHLDQDQLGDARTHADQALASHRRTGHRLGEADTLAVLARTADTVGDASEAVELTNAAQALYSKLRTADAGGRIRHGTIVGVRPHV